MALNSLICADVPLANYSLTHSRSSGLCVCLSVSQSVCVLVYLSGTIGLRKSAYHHYLAKKVLSQ